MSIQPFEILCDGYLTSRISVNTVGKRRSLNLPRSIGEGHFRRQKLDIKARIDGSIRNVRDPSLIEDSRSEGAVKILHVIR